VESLMRDDASYTFAELPRVNPRYKAWPRAPAPACTGIGLGSLTLIPVVGAPPRRPDPVGRARAWSTATRTAWRPSRPARSATRLPSLTCATVRRCCGTRAAPSRASPSWCRGRARRRAHTRACRAVCGQHRRRASAKARLPVTRCWTSAVHLQAQPGCCSVQPPRAHGMHHPACTHSGLAYALAHSAT